MSDQDDQPVDVQRLRSLMEYASKTYYRTNSNTAENDKIMKTCLRLFSKDYKYSLINNQSGELCGHYPPQIVVLEYQTAGPVPANEQMESMHDMRQMKELITRARLARCRSRFAVPVILCEGKHILRGATISGGAEMYGRQVYDMLISGGGGASLSGGGDATPSTSGSANPESDSNSNDWLMFTKVRGADIKLLKMFQVGYIFDLMVEKKKVKFGMNVTSSEKVDKENRYSEFNIVTMPYPGCEFFRTWKDCGYQTEGMVFDWSQGDVNVVLDLPHKPSPPRGISWSRYRNWDLACLTQNYLRLLLHYLREGDSGLLVHCISGWDRTPLYISLLRLSLWAESLIHQSLTAIEVLYLTVAYDWFLFGHNFPDRLKSGEDVFFFCFNFLKYITDDDFNINSRPRRRKASSRADSECQFDGVLLDVDGGPQGSGSSCRGSNTSISSIGSLNSTRSSIDNPGFPASSSVGSAHVSAGSVPVSASSGSGVCFNIGSVEEEEDSFVNGLQTSSSTLRTSPAVRSPSQSGCFTASMGGLSSSPAYITSSSLQQSMGGASGHTGKAAPGGNTSCGSGSSVGSNQSGQQSGTVAGTAQHVSGLTGSSPVAVPRAVQRVSSDARSVAASCGSWQMILTPESYHARYGTPVSIPSSAASDHRSSSGSESRDHGYPEHQSTRRQRLDAVRWYFLSAYRAAVDPNVPSFMPCYTDISHHSPPSSASPSFLPSGGGAASGGSGGEGASGFTSMFENFAEKVGIRSSSAKSTLV